MAVNKIKIELNTEQIVKLTCSNFNCINNIAGSFDCNLKLIELNDKGSCMMKNMQPSNEKVKA